MKEFKEMTVEEKTDFLKAEIEYLEDEELGDINNKIEELTGEIESSNYRIDDIENEIEDNKYAIEYLKDEIKELKEDNKELRQQNKELQELLFKVLEKMLDEEQTQTTNLSM